jgi:hypothetical protein
MTNRTVAVNVETAFGGGTPVPAFPLHATSVTDPIDRGAMLEETISYPLYAAAYGGALRLSGSVEGVLRMPSMDPLFQGVFGAPTASEYSIANFPKSLVMELIDDSSAVEKCFRYVGVGIKSFEITAAAKDFARTRWDWFAKDVQQVAPSTLGAFPDDKPGIFYGTTLSLGGTPLDHIKSMNLRVDRKLDDDYFVVGHSKIQDLAIAGVADVGGSITIGQKYWPEYQRAVFGSDARTAIGDTTDNILGQATFSMDFNDPDGGNIITIAADTLCYLDASRNMQGRNMIDKTMNFKVIGDSLTVIDGSS